MIKLSNLPENATLRFTKEEFIEIVAYNAMILYENLLEMAKENWCESQVEDLERLFEEVISGQPYAQQPEEE